MKSIKYITNINENKYFEKYDIKLKKMTSDITSNVININIDNEQQQWLGMGGAITEASGYNYFLLNEDKRKEFITSYYSIDGLNYNIGRISIGSNDFSLKSYEYTKKKDLSDFSIKEDYNYIIPLLTDIYKQKKIMLLATPWSPPKFMKNNHSLFNGGYLKKKYYDLYVKYLNSFINEYNNIGFSISYITIQNEPFAKQKWESCIFSLEEQKDFIYNYLINNINNTKIVLWDHNKEDIYNVVKSIYKDNDKIAGIGFHWYSGGYFDNLKLIKKEYPNLLMINTEMCCGFSSYNEIEWIVDAKLYLKEIINDINSGMNIFIDWNILLNNSGGPNHVKNYCKSPIILNEDNNDFIKTPIYYYLKHIAIIPHKSKVLFTSSYDLDLFVCAFKDKEDIYIVVLNNNNENRNINILINDNYIEDNIASDSIITYKVYN